MSLALFNDYYRNKIYKLIDTSLELFQISTWLHVFSGALISIFIPIFLLQMDYSIASVMLYYMIYNIFDFPFNLIAKKLVFKIGAKNVIAIGSAFSILFFVLLYNLTPNNWTLLIAMALFAAIYDAFYWVARVYFFMKCSPNDDDVSKDTSKIKIIEMIAGLLAPIIGAGILIFFNQRVLIIISTTILALSLWPLYKIKKIDDKPKIAKNFKEFFYSRNVSKEYIIQGLFSFHRVTEAVVWPIFIFTIFHNIESVALIPIIVSITAIMFTYFIGNISKGKRTKSILVGAIFISIIWILRIYINNSIFYYLSVLLMGLFAVFISIPQDSNLYEKGERNCALSASTYRNTASMFPRIFFYALLFILVDIFRVSFVIAVVGTIALMLVSYLFTINMKNKSFI